jgi:zinc and cadmium transporter
MSPLWLLFIYALICIVASLAGGWVPLVVKLTHRRMQIAISFVSGIILGIGLLHLLPHSVSILGSIDRTVGWVMGGFLFIFFLER